MRWLFPLFVVGCGLPRSEARTIPLPEGLSAYRLSLPVGEVILTSGDSVGAEATSRWRGSEAPSLEVDEQDGVVEHVWDCDRRCEVDLAVTLPADLAGLTVDLGTGDVDAEVLDADQVTVSVGTGQVALGLTPRPEDVAVDVGTGNIRVDVPAGAYALDLSTGLGSVDVGADIESDDDADASITAGVGVGNVRVESL